MVKPKLVLSADGGSLRGVFSAAVIEQMERVNGRPAREIFDSLWGTSTGSMIACALGEGISAARLRELYITVGSALFGKPDVASLTAAQRELEGMVEASGLAPGRGCLVPPEKVLAEDPTATRTWVLEQILKVLFGSRRLCDVPVALAVTTLDTRSGELVFLNNFLKDGSEDTPLWRAVRMSAALPPLFCPVDDRYLDGGVSSFANPSFAAFEVLTRRHGWKRSREAFKLFSVGTTYHPPLLQGQGISEGLETRYSKAYPDLDQDGLMTVYMNDAMMQQVNQVQDQVMQEEAEDGCVTYHRYNVSLDAGFSARYGAALAQLGIDVSSDSERLQLFDLSLGQRPVWALGMVGELVGHDLVSAGDFGDA